MKIKLLKPVSSDAGTYIGLPEDKIAWGNVVEARYCNRVKGVMVKGKEFIRLGALPEHFVDRWVTGFWESGSEMVSNCNKY